MKSIVTAEWLHDHLEDENIRVIDCRFQLGTPHYGFEAYLADHIKGACYFDLEKDLSGPIEEHGGRHPLPNLDNLSNKLSAAGIDKNVHVVAYDDQKGMFATRLWWMLKYLGHEKVSILDDAYSNWKSQLFPTSNDIPSYKHRDFKPDIQKNMMVVMEDVREFISNKDGVLIDSRENNRYLGINEPIDPKAGHIPTAKNFFWMDNIKETGGWKSQNDLEERFKEIAKDDLIIVYCGSGVSACPNVFALNALGYENVKLYAGSWSDWITYDDNPIETGAK